MTIISAENCIRCRFDFHHNIALKDDIIELEVFYAETKDLNSRYDDLSNYITTDEQLRADRFHFDMDRETYISCHAMLRLVLSKKLNNNPLEISFISNINNKPNLKGDSAFFNITHTRDAFAFAISSHNYVGIDLERINLNIDFTSIIEKYFSKKERDYILNSSDNKKKRFYLLWTRKEALLKAIGIGIINDLHQVEVSGRDNVICNKPYGNLFFNSVSSEHFIYSKKLLNYYLSIATPKLAKIILNRINEENINSYIDFS